MILLLFKKNSGGVFDGWTLVECYATNWNELGCSSCLTWNSWATNSWDDIV